MYFLLDKYEVGNSNLNESLAQPTFVAQDNFIPLNVDDPALPPSNPAGTSNTTFASHGCAFRPLQLEHRAPATGDTQVDRNF